jgi:hypothetical protein
VVISSTPDELFTPTQQLPLASEFFMRSEQIHRAIAKGNTRFEICQLVAKGVKVTHKPGARFEDSIGNVLGHLGLRQAAPRQATEHVGKPDVDVLLP